MKGRLASGTPSLGSVSMRFKRLTGLSGAPIEERQHRSIRTSHSLLWIHGRIGVDERVDQAFDSSLEYMDVLVRLDADHILSHP